LLLKIGLEVVHCREVVFGSDEIVQIAHICLFAMRGIGAAKPPHPRSVAQLEVLEFAVYELV
jgi:hypothetical protein